MGSLVGGWDSPVHHTNQGKMHGRYAVTCGRNNSLTKEEIDAYWRSNKKKAQDQTHQHLESYSHENAVGTKYPHRRSNSLPITTGKEAAATAAGEQQSPTSSWEEFMDNRAKGWWRRSNWAFLNEPPVFEGTTRGYSSQFNVANFDRAKDSSAFGP